MLTKSLIFTILAMSLIPFTAHATARCSDQGFVEFRYEPAPPGHYVDLCGTPEDHYNADLTTGDEDVLHHPDLNIDL